jgi:hypothetical protein
VDGGGGGDFIQLMAVFKMLSHNHFHFGVMPLRKYETW